MKQNKREFLGVLCGLLMTVILAAVPLCTGGTYFRIGDTKYILFRNAAFLCLGLWVIVETASFCAGLPGRIRAGRKNGMRRGAETGAAKKRKMRFCSMDIWMLSYAGCVILSALCSGYGKTAWLGYRDWYMGAASQLLFVGIYFLVSRYYKGQKYPLYLGEAALLAVAALGLLNRVKIDPLRLFVAYGENDWEYSHMLSTVGNINWLCGYLGMALVIPMARFLEGPTMQGEQDRGEQSKMQDFQGTQKNGKWYQIKSDSIVRITPLYLLNVLGLVLLCIQGSDTGPALAAAFLILSALLGFRDLNYLRKGLALTGGAAVGILVMAYFISLRESIGATPYDGSSHAILAWSGWWYVAGIAFAAAVALRGIGRVRKTGTGIPKRFLKGAGILLVAAVVGLTAAYLLRHPVGDQFGTGRGGLWRTAWEGFENASPMQKLIGAGPDCFAETLDTTITSVGHWKDSVYANAHNEWLNQLVNIGVLGTLCYAGIFLSGARRYRGQIIGIFAVTIYLINSLVSFQQVLNAPMLFLLLGICESRRIGRHRDIHGETIQTKNFN